MYLPWYYYAVTSAVFMSLATLIEKQTLKVEHATSYSSAFSFLVALLSLVFLPLVNFNISFLTVAFIYLSSILSTATYLLTARIYKHGSVSASSPVLSSLPIFFTVILAYLLLQEALTYFQYLIVAVLVIATYLLAFRKLKPGDVSEFESDKYRYMLVSTAFLMGVGAIIGKYILTLTDVYTYLVIEGIFIAFNFIFIISARYNGIREIMQTISTYRVPIASIVVLTIVSRITYYLAISVAAVSIVTPIRRSLFTVLTVLIGAEMFREEHLKSKLMLCLIMLVCSYLLLLGI